jgi:cytochrome c oxidase subunit 2
MVPTPELIEGEFRNLAVDNAMVVPTDTEVRIIVTSTDVIHSFGVPALGLKIDATPGRLNQASFLTEKEGVYYGQCSELCGVAHGFMPIMIESVDPQDYLVFLGTLLDESDK